MVQHAAFFPHQIPEGVFRFLAPPGAPAGSDAGSADDHGRRRKKAASVVTLSRIRCAVLTNCAWVDWLREL